MKEKRCPIMSQGWIAGYVSMPGVPRLTRKESIEKLPRCLKDDCQCWIEQDGLGNDGYCGLIHFKVY